MKTSLMCMECNIKQLIKLSTLLGVNDEKQEEATRKLLATLSTISFEKSNPEIMSLTWKIITDVFQNNDPYKEIKEFYNSSLLEMYTEINEVIKKSTDPINTALKIAIIGNIIDFGARHKFTKDSVFEKIKQVDNIHFKIDDRFDFFNKLNTTKTLLYIGDNCGEIVLDKLLIKTLKEYYPKMEIFFGVRGGNILNDVTEIDAIQVNIAEYATVVSSGASVPGTVLGVSNPDFVDLFHSADMVIAKGQGNFESLSDEKRENLYLMLLAKCSYVANTLEVNEMDFIIKHNKKSV